ncbi:MAG TPA: pitrilysin family protein [Thermoanaerobaculia bacterium]|nr:pitrilysin family protein [Thermoanaerobaculia bacterium]
MSIRAVALGLAAAFLLLPASGRSQNVQVQDYTLPNGLRVVLNEDHSAPLVAVNIWYHVGSKDEKPGRTGFAHLFEHMLFSGSQHVQKNEHFGHIQSVGGILNGSTNLDRTNYYETVPSSHLPLALWLEADRMGFFLPALDQEKLDVQKQVVKEERRQRYDNVPYGTWLESLLRNAYPADYPYHWPTIGSMADLTAAELDDVKEFFRMYYSPNNAVLTLVGDFDPAEARTLIAKYFGPIPSGPEVRRFTTPPPPIGGEKREVVPGAVQLPRVYRMYHVPKFGEREWIAADLLNSVLTNGRASRLERSLVYEQQIAQDAVGFTWDAEAGGMMIMWATAKPGVPIERVEAALDAELRRVAASGVTNQELARAKTAAEAGIANQLNKFAARADLINQVTTLFGDPRLVNDIIPQYQAITAKELQDVAARYLVPDNRVTVTFVPQPTTAEVSMPGDMEGGQ